MATNDANKPEGPLVWVWDDAGVDALMEAIRTASEVVPDLETTGLDEYAVAGGNSNGGYPARVVLASFTLPQEGDRGRWDGVLPTTYVLPLSHPDSPFLGTWRRTFARVMQAIVTNARPANNQNIKFDARWSWVHGKVDLAPYITWDTQVGSHLLDETLPQRLKERVPIEFEDEGVQAWNDFDLSVPGAAERVPLFELGEYAARDTWWTWRLAQNQRMEMFIDGGGYPEPLFDGRPESTDDYQTARLGPLAGVIAMPTVASLTRMENNGVRVDVPWMVNRLKLETAKWQDGLDKMAAMYGMGDPADRFGGRARATIQATALWFMEFTRRAVEADDLRIISMTGAGRPQWNKGVLKKNMRRGSTVADLILETRSASTLSTYLNSWLNFVRPDGRIHATYKVGNTRTGRLSGADPNMQQVSKKLKNAFIPSEGYYFADFDFSQIELRVAAFIADCIPMKEAFARGEDLHRLLGAKMVSDRNRRENERAAVLATRGEMFLTPGERAFLAKHVELPELVKPEDVSADDRQASKAQNFGLLYLQSPAGFREYAESVYGVVLTLEEAAQFHAGFFEMWPGMHEWHQRVIAKVHHDGYITAPTGRVRRLPGINAYDQWTRSEAERQAVNCFDAETEALTQRGWVKGFDLKSTDKLLTFNKDTQELSWATPLHRWFYPDYDGKFMRMSNGYGFDSWTTPEHRWPVRQKKTGEWVVRNTEQLSALSPKQSDYSIPAVGKYSQSWSGIPADLAALVGWVLTDGYVGKTFIGIAQTKSNRRGEIEALLERMGVQWNVTQPKEGSGKSAQYKIHGIVADHVKRLVGVKKNLSSELVLSLGDVERAALFDAMMAGDGHVEAGGRQSFVAGSEERADAFQFLCTLLGKASKKFYREYGENDVKANGSLGYWNVTIYARERVQNPIRETVENSTGGAWCVTVPNSFAVFRRSGGVFISGNTTVQGFASDLMQAAAADVQGLMPGTTAVPGVRLVLTVHDSIGAELPVATWREAKDEVVRRMEESHRWLAKLGVQFDVPIKADVSVGTRWGWNDISDPEGFAHDHPELAASREVAA